MLCAYLWPYRFYPVVESILRKSTSAVETRDGERERETTPPSILLPQIRSFRLVVALTYFHILLYRLPAFASTFFCASFENLCQLMASPTRVLDGTTQFVDLNIFFLSFFISLFPSYLFELDVVDDRSEPIKTTWFDSQPLLRKERFLHTSSLINSSERITCSSPDVQFFLFIFFLSIAKFEKTRPN